jgi:ABC-2 type transport system ATP-binding protein
MSAIVLRGVRKSFGPKVAVEDLDLDVPEGSLYGFIGPNGAGKTTTIRMIMSILFPDRGDIAVLGHRSALDAKDRIGYLPEERGVYKKMKVGAFLRYMARLKGHDGNDLDGRVRSWLERVDLEDVENKKCEELSKGMQQKVQFIAAVIHEPNLLILDEPFSGLDPMNMRLLRQLIGEQHERGATVIFSTHVMVHAEQVCDRIVMIDEGQKVLDDPLTTIRRNFDPRALLFEPLEADADLAPLRQLSFVEDVFPAEGAWQLSLAEGADIPEAMHRIVSTTPVARLEVRRPTLEDIFVQIVRERRGVSAAEARLLRAQLEGGAVRAEA